MTETIQQLKEDISILQEKLRKLEAQQEPEMTLKKSGDCDMVSYDHKYYYRLSFGVGDYYWYKRYIGSSNLMKVEDPEEHRLVEELYDDTMLDTGGVVEEQGIWNYDPDAKFRKQEPEENEWKLVALRLGEKLSDNGPGGYYDFTAGEWFEWVLNECERGMIKRNLKTSLQEREKLQEKEWNVVRESVKWCEEHPDWDLFDCLNPQTEKQIKKLQEKERSIKVVTDYLTGKSRHKLNIVDKDGNGYKPEPFTTEELLKPQPEKRKIDDLAEKLLPDDHPYKITDEHGETNPYLQYLNSEKEWEPKPQSEKEVEEGLRSAMRTAIKEGIISDVKQPTDELIDELVKNPPEFLKFELGKTLEDIVNRWWEDTFTIHETWSTEECISDLVDQIQLWLPKEQSAAGSQSLGVEDMVEGFNDCLKKIKSKLRNKKDT